MLIAAAATKPHAGARREQLGEARDGCTADGRVDVPCCWLGACASGTLQSRARTIRWRGRSTGSRTARGWSEAALVADASGADFVLIGERHDNPEHHRLQARLVAALQRGHGPRAVAFEMIPAWRQLEIVEYLAADGDPAGLGEAIAWDAGGWPEVGLV